MRFVYTKYIKVKKNPVNNNKKKILSFNKTTSLINTESEKNLCKRKAYLILFSA